MENDRITVIRPGRGWYDIDWKEFWAYRELLLLLAKRDITVIYKQTILGPAWFLIQPLLMAVVFSVVFGRIAHIPTDGMPRILFYLSGLLVWNYFKGVMDGASGAFSNAKALFSKVYFPRLVVPTSFVVSNLVYLSLNAVIFFCFYGAKVLQGTSGIHVTPWVLLFPLVVLWIAATAMGFGLIVAALTTKYRDLKFAMPFVMQCWMYSSPIIYSLKGVQDPFFQLVLMLNPVGVAVEATRFMFFGRGLVTWTAIGVGAAVILATIWIGLGAYNRAQRNFVDTI